MPCVRHSERALGAEPLPESGAKPAGIRQEAVTDNHCAALAYVWCIRRPSLMVVLKGDPLKAAPEAAIHVNTQPAVLSRLTGNVRCTAADHSARRSGVHCRCWMPLGHMNLGRREEAARDLTSRAPRGRQLRRRRQRT